MKSGASTLVFAFNHGDAPVDATIGGISGRARDLETGERLETLQHRFRRSGQRGVRPLHNE